MTTSHADIAELNQLACRYAAAVDSCDTPGFLAVFVPDARLRSYHPNSEEPFADLKGHGQLAAIPEAMRGRYAATAHMMTNHLVSIKGDGATGEMLCTARHLANDNGETVSLNVIIRYLDQYVRQDRAWYILDRQIRFLWSETHAVADRLFGQG